ncbi:nudix hydrolase 3 [Candidatus Magnetomorum sp. HK-1]|nr:nudix hydrolase 3 [Candidatus Magnetomorum sp. HK-1]
MINFKIKIVLIVFLSLTIIGLYFYRIKKNDPQLSVLDNKVIKYMAPKAYVHKTLSQYKTVKLSSSISHISSGNKKALDCLFKASTYLNNIYLKQIYKNNDKILIELEKLKGTDYQIYYDMFSLMSGPWNHYDDNKSFINKINKPIGVSFYPEDITKDEFTNWIEKNPNDKEKLTSPFTIIKRNENGLEAIPYVFYYKKLLEQSAKFLYEAANFTDDKSLKDYLNKRAFEFTHNVPFMNRDSDIAWLKNTSDIEISLGAHETYDDCLFENKASFHSFIAIADRNENHKLNVLKKLKNKMEQNFPISDQYKAVQKNKLASIRIVNEVFASGLYRLYSPTAFNYPNDPYVKDNFGSKQIMIKNVLKAKYKYISKPIAQRILTSEAQDKVTFDTVFNIILMHEIGHSLGPASINVEGKSIPVSDCLQENFWTIEECKADLAGMHSINFVMNLKNENPFPDKMENSLYVSYLVRLFRNIRYGTKTAHGKAVLIQLNYHKQNKGLILNENGLYQVNNDLLRKSIKDLLSEVLMIQATGNKHRAASLIKNYAIESSEIKNALQKMENIPKDIFPIFPMYSI